MMLSKKLLHKSLARGFTWQIFSKAILNIINSLPHFFLLIYLLNHFSPLLMRAWLDVTAWLFVYLGNPGTSVSDSTYPSCLHLSPTKAMHGMDDSNCMPAFDCKIERVKK